MHQIPYHRETLQPVSDVIPGNRESANPVEFDLAPAWGPDLARIKSIIFAALGLVAETGWTPDVQAAVIAAYDTGAPAFVNTIEAIRGLSVPAAAALRAGLISQIPTKLFPGESEPRLDYDAPVAITTGLAFSKICGMVSPMALHVAMKISELTQRADIDPRFFAQPSGSGIPETPGQKAGTAKTARNRSRRRGTAGNGSTPAAGS